MPPNSRVALHRYLWILLVGSAVLAIYLPGLGSQPVFDDAFLTEGPLLQLFNTLQLRPRMFSYGSFVWIQSLLGDGWWKQRLVNVALHVAVVAALWAFYREILRAFVAPRPEPGEPHVPYYESPALALAIGYFALNPVAAYAVAYLIQRSIVMATLFTILALWLFARGVRTRQVWLYALAAASYALAVLSKEHAVLAPLAALPVYIAVARPSAKRLALVTAVSAALLGIAAALLWTRFGQIFGAPFDEYSRAYLAQLAALDPDAPRRAWPLSIENQCWLFLEYGVRWFFPVGDWMSICLRPPFPVKWLSWPQALGAPAYLAILAGSLWLVVRHRDWRGLVGLALALPAILFATEFATVWVQDSFVLYRSYLWAIGVPGLIVAFAHGTSARALLVIGAIVGILFVWQSVERVSSLATPETAWTDAIAKLPRDPRAVGRWFPYLNRGSYYVDHDRFELAIRDFETSAALGDLGMGAFNTGSALNATGKPQQALRLFEVADKQGYDLYSLPFQRGLAYAALGKQDEAYRQFEKALGMQPPADARPIVQLVRARAALQTSRYDVAIADLREVLSQQPGNAEARYLLAMAHVAKHEHAQALEVIDAPPASTSGSAHYARALAYHGLGRKADAQREIEAAVRAAPGNALLRQWQARIDAMK